MKSCFYKICGENWTSGEFWATKGQQKQKYCNETATKPQE